MKLWKTFAADGIVIFDTDILIWIQRGNEKAARLVDREKERLISIQTYMELLQCAQNRQQHNYTRQFLKVFGFHILPMTENIGHRAAVYVEEHSLSSGMRAGDAIIAATAAENNLKLCTGNARHFRIIKDLQLKIFKP